MPKGNPTGYDDWEDVTDQYAGWEDATADFAAPPAVPQQLSKGAPGSVTLTGKGPITADMLLRRPTGAAGATRSLLIKGTDPAEVRAQGAENVDLRGNRADIPADALDPYSPDRTFGGALMRSFDTFTNFARGGASTAYNAIRAAGSPSEMIEDISGSGAARAAGLPAFDVPTPEKPPAPPAWLEPTERQGEPNLWTGTAPHAAGRIAAYFAPGAAVERTGMAGETAILTSRFARDFPKMGKALGIGSRATAEAGGGAALGMVESDDPEDMKWNAMMGGGLVGGSALVRALLSLKVAPALLGGLLRPSKKDLKYAAEPAEGILGERLSAMSMGELIDKIDNRVGELDLELRKVLVGDPRRMGTARQRFWDVMEQNAREAEGHGRKSIAKTIRERRDALMRTYFNKPSPGLDDLLNFRRELGRDVKWARSETGEINLDETMRDAYRAMDDELYAASPMAERISMRQHDLLAALEAARNRVDDALVETYRRLGTLGAGGIGALTGAGISINQASQRGETPSIGNIFLNTLTGLAAGTAAGSAVGKVHGAWGSTPAVTGRARLYRAMWPEPNIPVAPPPPPQKLLTEGTSGVRNGQLVPTKGRATAAPGFTPEGQPLPTSRRALPPQSTTLADSGGVMEPNVRPYVEGGGGAPSSPPDPNKVTVTGRPRTSGAQSYDVSREEVPAEAIPIGVGDDGVEEFITIPAGLTPEQQAAVLGPELMKKIAQRGVQRVSEGVPGTVQQPRGLDPRTGQPYTGEIGSRQTVPYEWAVPDAEGGAAVREQVRRGFGPAVDSITLGDVPPPAPPLFTGFPAPPPDRGIDNVFRIAEGLPEGRPIGGLETAGIPETAPPLTADRPPTSFAPESTEARVKAAAGIISPSGPPAPPPAVTGPGKAKVGNPRPKGPFTPEGGTIGASRVVVGGKATVLASAEGKGGQFISVRAQETTPGTFKVTRSEGGGPGVELGTFTGTADEVELAAKRVLAGQPLAPRKMPGGTGAAPVRQPRSRQKAERKARKAQGTGDESIEP